MDINTSLTGTELAYTQELSEQNVKGDVNPSKRQLNDENESSAVSAVTNNSEVPKETVNNADSTVNEKEVLENAISEIESFIDENSRNLSFLYEGENSEAIIKVTDPDSGDLIRQIPSEEMLDLAQRISEYRERNSGQSVKTGVLIDNKV